MIIHADVDERVFLRVVDQDRGRLPAALVAPGRLAGPEREEEALEERPPCRLLEGRDRVADHFGPGQHVAGDGEVLAQLVPAPGNASGARIGRVPAVGRHQVNLPVSPALIRRGHDADRVLRPGSRLEERQAA